MKKVIAAIIALAVSACLFCACAGAEGSASGKAETTEKTEKVLVDEDEDDEDEEETTTEETTAEETDEETEKSTEAEQSKPAETEATTESTGAVSDTNVSETQASKANAVKYEDSLTGKMSKSLNNAMKSGSFAYTFDITENGQKTNAAFFAKDSKYRIDMSGKSQGQSINMSIIIKDGKTYLLDHASKMGSVSNSTQDINEFDQGIDDILIEADKETYEITSEEVIFEGKPYTCETIVEDGSTYKYYYAAGQYTDVLIIEGTTRVNLRILPSPSSSKFDIPSDYQIVEM